jgi:hypothetical protein
MYEMTLEDRQILANAGVDPDGPIFTKEAVVVDELLRNLGVADDAWSPDDECDDDRLSQFRMRLQIPHGIASVVIFKRGWEFQTMRRLEWQVDAKGDFTDLTALESAVKNCSQPGWTGKR